MLHNLEILNGELSPTFDENNNTYTVSVDSDVTSLKLTYTIDKEANVNIIGNSDFEEGENTVLIEVTKENDAALTYTLIVTKKSVKTSSNLVIEPVKAEVTKNLPIYVAPLIASVCFILILISFRLIFIRRKHK